ncbi:hypothetical protein [Streptomyces sp. NPDC127033]|uniref:hypothetical protein n=1 Tax=Streptomyces sp. NPDC127033 TaxID=3347110 RepID=UPI003648F8CF
MNTVDLSGSLFDETPGLAHRRAATWTRPSSLGIVDTIKSREDLRQGWQGHDAKAKQGKFSVGQTGAESRPETRGDGDACSKP